MVKKKLKFGALPTLNLPTRSHDIAPKPTRPARSIVSDDVNTAATSFRRYKSFEDLCSRIKTLTPLLTMLKLKKIAQPELLTYRNAIFLSKNAKNFVVPCHAEPWQYHGINLRLSSRIIFKSKCLMTFKNFKEKFPKSQRKCSDLNRKFWAENLRKRIFLSFRR